MEPDIVEYDKDSKLQYDLILGTETMKELGIVLNIRDKMILLMKSFCQLETSIICKALAFSKH